MITLEQVREIKEAHAKADRYFMCESSPLFKELWEVNSETREVLRQLAKDFLAETQQDDYAAGNWSGTMFYRKRGNATFSDYHKLRQDFLAWWIQRLESTPN